MRNLVAGVAIAMFLGGMAHAALREEAVTPLAYDPDADKQSKAEASRFFSAVFGN